MPTATAGGLDRIGGWHRKALGETCLQVPSDRHGSSALAVGALRDVKETRKQYFLGAAGPLRDAMHELVEGDLSVLVGVEAPE